MKIEKVYACKECRNIFRAPIEDGVCDSCKDDLVYRLRKRAEIRRQIKTRKSVQEGKPDRLANLLDEAASEIKSLRQQNKELEESSGSMGPG